MSPQQRLYKGKRRNKVEKITPLFDKDTVDKFFKGHR